MATNPYFTQYHTQRFSFIGSLQQRDGTSLKDQRFLNVYPELIKSPISDGKKYYIKKRPGLQLFAVAPSQGGARGVFFWNQQYFYSTGTGLYAGTSIIASITNRGCPVGFTVFQHDSGVEVLIVADGSLLWQVDTSNVVTQLTGAPNPHVPNPVYLDGYIFLAQFGTNTIWNCAQDTPSSWPADQFINAEMYPFPIQSLVKNSNYVVSISSGSIEFFYDNANATGSPLARNAPAVTQLGTPAGNTVNQTEKEIILVGSTENGGRTVWVVDGFQPKEIGTEPVREALDAEGASITGAYAFTIQVAGHKWYVLNLYANNRTFVYDFEEAMWHEWTTGTGQNVFSCNFACDSPLGFPILQDSSVGNLVELTPMVYTDEGNTINCEIVTVKIDFDTVKRKRLYRLSVVGDAPNGDNNVPMSLYFSDDDYNTWIGPRTIQLNGDYSTITNLGLSRRRAFKFVYQQNFSLRLESFEVDIIEEVRR